MEFKKGDYAYVKLVGHSPIKVWAHPEREGQQPHFKSDGCAVWLRQARKSEGKD